MEQERFSTKKVEMDSQNNVVKTHGVDPDDPVNLKRRLELHHGVGIVCGLIMGMGIFVSPAGVANGAGSGGLTLILWVIGGSIAILGALTFAELGTTFPCSGEKYAYLQKMYSPFVAFLYLWIYLLFFRTSANAIKVITISRFLLQPILGETLPQSAIILIGFLFAAALGFINCITVKWSARMQTLISCVNCAALFTIIISGFVTVSTGTGGSWEYLSFRNTNTNVGEVMVGLYSSIFAFGGWNALNFMIEELKDPYKNLPRSILIAMSIVFVLYFVTNISYLAVLGPAGVAATKGVAMTLSAATLGPHMWVMALLVTFNIIGSYNSGLLVGSRLGFVGTRKGHMPAVLGLIQLTRRTPITAIIFQTIIVFGMCFLDVFSLINNITFAHNIFNFLAVFGMIYLRIKRPDIKRPLKLPLIIPLLYCISIGILIIFPLVLKPGATVVGVAIGLCTGIPYYCIIVKRMVKFKTLDRLAEVIMKVTQKILICVPEEGHKFEF